MIDPCSSFADIFPGGGGPLADVFAIAIAARPLRPPLLGDRPDRPDMSAPLPAASLSAADVFGLVVSALVCVYLVYALLRGENL